MKLISRVLPRSFTLFLLLSIMIGLQVKAWTLTCSSVLVTPGCGWNCSNCRMATEQDTLFPGSSLDVLYVKCYFTLKMNLATVLDMAFHSGDYKQ